MGHANGKTNSSNLMETFKITYMRRDVEPQLNSPIAVFEAHGFGQTAIDIMPTEVGFGVVDHLIAMRIEF